MIINLKYYCFLLVSFFLFSLCSCRSDPEKVARRVEKYPHVKEVLFVAVDTGDWSDRVGVSVLMDNGGIVTVLDLDHQLGEDGSVLMDIGPYQFQYGYQDYVTKQEIKSSVISIKELEKMCGRKFSSLKSIIKYSDDILKILERIYPPPDKEKSEG